jgi:hypothetical protein
MLRPLRPWLVCALLLFGCDAEDSEGGDTDAAADGDTDEGADDETGDTDDAIPEGGRTADLGPGDDPSIRPVPCGDDGTNSYSTDGVCFCFTGFSWCDADNERSMTCCAEGSESEVRCSSTSELVEGACRCIEGYAWCTPDSDSLSCCPAMGE